MVQDTFSMNCNGWYSVLICVQSLFQSGQCLSDALHALPRTEINRYTSTGLIFRISMVQKQCDIGSLKPATLELYA